MVQNKNEFTIWSHLNWFIFNLKVLFRALTKFGKHFDHFARKILGKTKQRNILCSKGPIISPSIHPFWLNFEQKWRNTLAESDDILQNVATSKSYITVLFRILQFYKECNGNEWYRTKYLTQFHSVFFHQ